MADYSKDLYDYKYECRRNCSAFDDGYEKGASDMEQAKQIIIDALNREIDRLQEQNKWHLCEEELPNESVTYLCVVRHRLNRTDRWRWTTTELRLFGTVNQWIINENREEVIAWCELPKFESEE